MSSSDIQTDKAQKEEKDTATWMQYDMMLSDDPNESYIFFLYKVQRQYRVLFTQPK